MSKTRRRPSCLQLSATTNPTQSILGSAFEITIRDLVTLIAELTGFRGRVTWDASQPNGQPRRELDTSRAEKEFGFRSHVDFREGLKRTLEWYERHRQTAVSPYAY